MLQRRSPRSPTAATVTCTRSTTQYGLEEPPPQARIVLIAMALSGGLAGFVGVNEILGVQHRLLLEFVAGAGFTGIAVALMGRNHPFGIVLASILFGALYQGGAELAFEIPTITREMIITIQGLIILFSGALAYMNRPWVERAYLYLTSRRRQEEAPTHG